MYRIGVVGCGVAGTTSAYLLARDGHQITLLERAPKLGPIGAGILLQCSGQAVLRHGRIAVQQPNIIGSGSDGLMHRRIVASSIAKIGGVSYEVYTFNSR